MSDNSDRPAPEDPAPVAGCQESPGQMSDPTEALLRGLEKIRLPADVKEQILAELPPPEEQERLYRELREKGGLSSEEFFASLDLEAKPQP